ncbi:MAG TPA: M2 family metallopeptidase, partial [Cyclobacteriaceae bacterium]|nr:M2 family metallopeptidase [Cyclobacteriaceae bacterium]
MKKLLCLLLVFAACSNPKKDAQQFLDSYNAESVRLLTAANNASWDTNIHIQEGDTLYAYNARITEEALAAFGGSIANITRAKELLGRKSELDSLQVRQLESVLYIAAADPQTVAPLVKERIAATVEQTEKLFGYTYKIDGKAVTTNDIDQLLSTQTDPSKRLTTWLASKEVGKELKSGLVNLRRLRNSTVQA